MRRPWSIALLILLVPAAVSTAAKEERGATSDRAVFHHGLPALAPHLPRSEPSEGFVLGEASNVQNDDQAAPPESHSDSNSRLGTRSRARSPVHGCSYRLTSRSPSTRRSVTRTGTSWLAIGTPTLVVSLGAGW
jgi:hypothetical protein